MVKCSVSVLFKSHIHKFHAKPQLISAKIKATNSMMMNTNSAYPPAPAYFGIFFYSANRNNQVFIGLFTLPWKNRDISVQVA